MKSYSATILWLLLWAGSLDLMTKHVLAAPAVNPVRVAVFAQAEFPFYRCCGLLLESTLEKPLCSKGL